MTRRLVSGYTFPKTRHLPNTVQYSIAAGTTTNMSTQPPQKEEHWKTFFKVESERIIYKDDQIIAFHDQTPRAAMHILIVPRHAHIRGVESIQPKHHTLLTHMSRIAAELTKPATPILGFHQHPLRSVPHLHLHVLVPPFQRHQAIRYKPLFGRFQTGLGFIPLQKILDRLISKSAL